MEWLEEMGSSGIDQSLCDADGWGPQRGPAHRSIHANADPATVFRSVCKSHSPQTMRTSNPYSDNAEADDRWCQSQRQIVVEYLRRHGVEHGAIGEWPAWHLAPYVSIWAIESIARPGWIGWWAISGDLPTDYISSSEVDGPQHPRKAMKVFARNWLELINAWNSGGIVEHTTIGDPSQREALAPLLQSRAEILAEWADDDSYWRS